MAFYVLKQDATIEGSIALDGVPDTIEPSEWIQGKLMDPLPEGLTLDMSLESGDYFGSIIESFLTLFHRSLREALAELNVDNIQYFPVVLRNQETGRTASAYSVANIIGLLDCMDKGASKIAMWSSGMGFDIESLVIDADKTHGAKIFRIADKPTLIIVNEEVKNYLEENDLLVGVDVIKTEDYSDW